MEKITSLEQFCDMAAFNRILSDWSDSTHLGVVFCKYPYGIVATYGLPVFCRTFWTTESGKAACRAKTFQHNDMELCHVCLYDCKISLKLPDGTPLGTLYCGQVCGPDSALPDFNALAARFGLDAEFLRRQYQAIPRVTQRELLAARSLLDNAVHYFLEKSYRTWQNTFEQGTDRILSQITKILYSYNVTVDLTTGKYTVIIGNGGPALVRELQRTDDFPTLVKHLQDIVHPSLQEQFARTFNLERLRLLQPEGFLCSETYPSLYPGDKAYTWYETNLFLNRAPNGRVYLNVLGRDVTQTHDLAERNARESRAAATKNQLLSDLTKMLYSYNLTLNLHTGKYTMIIGTGMADFIHIYQATDDYVTAYAQELKVIDKKSLTQFEHLTSLEELQARHAAHGFIGSLEYGVHLPGGEEWHEVNVFITTNEDGTPIANILGRDITDAHRRQEKKANAMKASMARDRLLSAVTKMLYSYNLTVNLKTWRYTLITGTGMTEVVKYMEMQDDFVLLHANLMDLLPVSFLKETDRLISVKALQAQRRNSGFIGSLTCPARLHGAVQWHEVNLFMGTDENGDPVANILGRDVTEANEQQARHERELRAAAAKDQILSEITQIIYSYNLSLNLQTGKYSLIIGTGMKQFVDILAATDDYLQAYRQKLSLIQPEFKNTFIKLANIDYLRSCSKRKGFIGNLEYAANGENGTEWHEINVFMSSNEDGVPIANILGRDVTEAHEKADTKAQLEIAKAANRAKSAFLSNMSHDIRTPINGIMGMLAIAKSHRSDPAVLDDCLHKIDVSSQHLLTLINDILDLNKLESGKMTFAKEPIDIRSIATDVITMVKQQAIDSEIDLQEPCFKNLSHPYIIGSPLHFRQVLVNIVSNAIKYNRPHGRVTITVEELRADDNICWLQTTVEDTGIGMSKEFQAHMFTAFDQESTAARSKYRGSGLGLAIVKRIIDERSGIINVESTQGVGTKFTIASPFTIDHNPIEHTAAAMETEEKIDLSGIKALLVEDNELNMEIAQMLLEDQGMIITTAEDGQEAVETFAAAAPGTFDVILMDIQMPRLDGMEATRTIRHMKRPDAKTIPIFAMTANAFAEDVARVKAAGMNEHIPKPLDLNLIVKTIAKYVKK